MDSRPPFGAWCQANDPILGKAGGNGLFMAFHERRRRLGSPFRLLCFLRAGVEVLALPLLLAASIPAFLVAGPIAGFLFLLLMPPLATAWLRSRAPRASRLPAWLLRCIHRGATLEMVEPILLVPCRTGEIAEAVVLEHVESRRPVWIIAYALFTAFIIGLALKPLAELDDEWILDASMEFLVKLLSPFLLLYTRATGRSDLIEVQDLWQPGEIAFASSAIIAAVIAWPLLRLRYQERAASHLADVLALSPHHHPLRRWILHISATWGQILGNLLFITVITTEAVAAIMLVASILQWACSLAISHHLPTLWEEDVDAWARQTALALTGICTIVGARLLASLAPQSASHWEKAATEAIDTCNTHLEDALSIERVPRPPKGKPVIPLFQFRRPKPSAS